MTNVQILPIFNQAAPYVWHDFARIYSCAVYKKIDYDENLLSSRRQICVKAQQLRQTQLSFAFGAYIKKSMVGFIQADAGESCGYIDSLYVLPEFQGRGIGQALLNSAEIVQARYVDKMFLASSAYGERFYQANGYVALFPGSNMYHKFLYPMPQDIVIPIFFSNDVLTKQFKQIDANFNQDIINVENKPTFAYFDYMSMLDGYIMSSDNGDSVSIHANGVRSAQMLKSKYKNYIQAYNNIHFR